MAWQVGRLDLPSLLSLIPRSHIVERENQLPKAVPRRQHIRCGTCVTPVSNYRFCAVLCFSTFLQQADNSLHQDLCRGPSSDLHIICLIAFMKKTKHKPCVVVHICNLRTGRLRQEDWEFEASLGYHSLLQTFYYRYLL